MTKYMRGNLSKEFPVPEILKGFYCFVANQNVSSEFRSTSLVIYIFMLLANAEIDMRDTLLPNI